MKAVLPCAPWNPDQYGEMVRRYAPRVRSSVSTPVWRILGLGQVDGVQGDTPPLLVGTLRHFELSQLILSFIFGWCPSYASRYPIDAPTNRSRFLIILIALNKDRSPSPRPIGPLWRWRNNIFQLLPRGRGADFSSSSKSSP